MKNKIIIINGPCGTGKSTVSLGLHETMPLSFLLDIDSQRRFISQRREYKKESSKMALDIAEGILRACLDIKTDVIIDKMLFDESVLERYYEIAYEYNAEVCEIILWAPKKVVLDRSDKRGYMDAPGAFTREKCEYFWDKIDNLKDLRINAYLINTENLTQDQVLGKVEGIVSK